MPNKSNYKSQYLTEPQQFNFVGKKSPLDPVKQMLRDNSQVGKWDGTPEWLDP